MSTDVFQRLPPEIIIQILKDIADFAGLDSLLHTSKYVRDVISYNIFGITEELLATFPMTKEIPGQKSDKLFEIACLIREPGFKCSDLDDLQSRFTELSIVNFSENTIYRTLRQGAYIQRLACACISELRESLKIGIGSVIDANWEKTLFPDWRQHMTAETSWVEEYRIYRALWCLQILSDIYHASGSVALQGGRGGWGWISTEREKIPWFVSVLGSKPHESNCVAEALEHLGASCIVTSKGPVDDLTMGMLYPRYLPPIFESLQVQDLKIYLIWTPPAQPGRTMFGDPNNQALESVWGRHPNSLRGSRTSGIWCYLITEERRINYRPDSPVRNAKPLHRMGIFIWDTWRLVSLGICDPCGSNNKFPTPDFSRWFEPPQRARVREEGPLKRWIALVETEV